MSETKKTIVQGLSLLEMLVVIGLFSIITIMASRAILLTLRGSRKSDAIARVRENLDYSLAVIERNLRNAESIVECPNTNPNLISYIDQEGATVTFSCAQDSGIGYVASSSARLTSDEVNVSSCSFTCDPGSGTSVPPSVTIDLKATDVNTSGVEGAEVTVSTKIFLRSY